MAKKKKKKEEEIYLPQEILDEASMFIDSISTDVATYKNIKKLDKLEPNKEADEFEAWWYTGAIYDYKEEIEKFCETSNLMDVFSFLQKKMIFLYRLIKSYGYIE